MACRGVPEGARLYVVNSAQAPFGGDDPPELSQLIHDGDGAPCNPHPWVLRIDIDPDAPTRGQPRSVFSQTAAAELNPVFKRLSHDSSTPAPDEPPPLEIAEHAHRITLLTEANPPGHLYVQEIVGLRRRGDNEGKGLNSGRLLPTRSAWQLRDCSGSPSLSSRGL